MHEQLTTTGQVPDTAPEVSSKVMRKVASVSLIGNMIEFYDFFIYATAAALVFPHLFFPALGDSAGAVASFATLGVAFVARPVGSVVFGHMGDRLGRKRTLVITLLTMGLATLIVGLMPTASQIGVAAPIIIVVLRLLQGLAAGGEWAGAVLYAAEYAPGNRRGFWSSFPPTGSGLALALGNSAYILVGLFTNDESFMSYGWRIPFLFSAVLVVVGLYIRLRTAETPIFKQHLKSGETTRAPLGEALRAQPRQVLLSAGSVLVIFVLYFVGSTYFISYGTADLGHSRNAVLAVVMAGGLAYAAACLAFGRLSDTYGRRRMLMLATGLGAVWSFVAFPLAGTGSLVAFAVSAIGFLAISGAANGPLGSFFAELYRTHYRYTAAALSYNVGAVLGGGVPPLIIASMVASLGIMSLAWFLAGVGAFSVACLLLLSETRTRKLDADHEVSGRRGDGPECDRRPDSGAVGAQAPEQSSN
ncbi:MFS transporter [Streptomyces luomodiensis]|uniref:MFS transporter n=1 Tax=Streptomyces luomodiensis TaxID=3026192 RepID=A0ABY9V663_9ACTN|nr:MFS transporter [Streptomyces sp. SCA4-21]WNF00363.1 MFS transporter [Streptomyces sp. SCA4-21]